MAYQRMPPSIRSTTIWTGCGLKKVTDFTGTFYGASHNINLGSVGKGEAVANNARCVVVTIRMKGEGLKVSGPAPGAVEVSFID